MKTQLLNTHEGGIPVYFVFFLYLICFNAMIIKLLQISSTFSAQSRHKCDKHAITPRGDRCELHSPACTHNILLISLSSL